MRRNIFDILEEEMNLEYEIETIVNLFNEARIYGFNINYSVEDYFDQECIHLWKNRKYVTSSKQMRERLGCSAEGSDCGGNSMVRAFSILPNVMEVMKYIGAAYILWLAIHIAFHTIHNYIDTKEMILRKGSIAAHKGEKVLIPINMRDGSVLAVGKGNPEWNYSAPHGAGRIMSRSKAKSTLSMEEYQETMKGIYTTSVTTATIDEAPMAYKSLEDIIDVIRDSVDIIEIMKPIYNFKSEK